MYDAILISSHYSYNDDGTAFPARNEENCENLSMIIPLGVVSVAQYLHDRGFDVRVVHLPHEFYMLGRLGVHENRVANLLEIVLKKYPARVCGIQAHWYLYCGGAVAVSNLYKNLFPDSGIFLGGAMASAYWKEFLTVSENIDGVVLGEGEKTFRAILEHFSAEGDRGLRNVDGVVFRNGKENFVFNPPGPDSVLGLDTIPIIHPDAPPFENLLWEKRQFITISRGVCPEKCAYCVGNNGEINSRAYRTMKIDKIIEQLRVYEANGFRRIFLGENQFLNISFMSELVEAILGESLSLRFELETHPVIFENDRLLEGMIRANFIRYTMGCESGSGSLLKRMGRNSSPGQVIDAVRRISERGGIVLTSWICNLPGETEAEFRETRTLLPEVVRVGGLVYWIENLHVLPGSKLHDSPERYGIDILLNNLEEWIRWSVLSKKYVDFEEARKEPLTYLTHVNRNATPEEMIERFQSHRELARSLAPGMRLNLENQCANLPPDILESEIRRLEWYEDKGWKLLLF